MFTPNRLNILRLSFLFLSLCISLQSICQNHSVARLWNEVLLESIRKDYARPTVHARNLFHSSILMYDLWAIHDSSAEPYLLGKELQEFECTFNGFESRKEKNAILNESISYGMYKLLKYRFFKSPGYSHSGRLADSLFLELGYDSSYKSMDYETGSPAALGNYMAQCIMDYGSADYSNEENEFENQFYSPVNQPLVPAKPGNPTIVDINRWQPLALEFNVDQSGNVIPKSTLDFLSPEWGAVYPFALGEDDLTVHVRDGEQYWVYHDPGEPCYMTGGSDSASEAYRWGFELVAIWSSHLDPSDSVKIDISPNSLGNIQSYPTNDEEMRAFYDLENGGDIGEGYALNPVTGNPYEENIVYRGDYTRVLAEFWADGPASETPPGHWFTILNYVSDHPQFVKRWQGSGEVLTELEWDVKSYFTLAGAVHDAAVTAWGIKGCYDYIRPVSAFRALADFGQSSDPSLPSYHPKGLKLYNGLVEMVEAGDPLAGANNKNVGKVKVKAWRGPEVIDDPDTDQAGVDWILAENWWPYQRPSFVTPPFAGYVSGHSVFSRSAAEVLTAITGDPYFPGGMGEFIAKKNEFLVFEEGPSKDIVLQWATYRDASDQTSLSRIWGGIHPPIDDMPGRHIGMEIGTDAFKLAQQYFNGTVTSLYDQLPLVSYYPNPVTDRLHLEVKNQEVTILDLAGRVVLKSIIKDGSLSTKDLSSGLYIVIIEGYKSFRLVKE